jgi:hypothetical protein
LQSGEIASRYLGGGTDARHKDRNSAINLVERFKSAVAMAST